MIVRLTTGLVLAVAIILLIWWSPRWLFAILAMVIVLMAWLEWAQIVFGKSATSSRMPSLLASSGALLIIIAALLLWYRPQMLPMMCLAGFLLWIGHAIGLARQWKPHSSGAGKDALSTGRNLLHGVCIFLFAWCALVWMREQESGAQLSIVMLLVVWSADSGAYFVGKGFGKHKLAPTISPNKTIEGFFGGQFGAVLISLLLVSVMLELNTAQTQCWLVASLSAALFSVVGDLHESRLKRRAAVKHSGTLLPGHGGMLDRIDGLVAAAPVFSTVWWLCG